jgi:hypothetical protein
MHQQRCQRWRWRHWRRTRPVYLYDTDEEPSRLIRRALEHAIDHGAVKPMVAPRSCGHIPLVATYSYGAVGVDVAVWANTTAGHAFALAAAPVLVGAVAHTKDQAARSPHRHAWRHRRRRRWRRRRWPGRKHGRRANARWWSQWRRRWWWLSGRWRWRWRWRWWRRPNFNTRRTDRVQRRNASKGFRLRGAAKAYLELHELIAGQVG